MAVAVEHLTSRQRFLNVMEYESVDRVPNYEVGVWAQTRDCWLREGIPEHRLHWDWFQGEAYYRMDAREYIHLNTGMMPSFEEETLEETDRHVVYQDTQGRVRKAPKEGAVGGARLSMDQYLRFPVETVGDFRKIKKRYIASLESRYASNWREVRVRGWNDRDHDHGPDYSPDYGII